jgi:hypothetical protein
LPVIVDPGTYLYTGDMAMRRLFRSTAYHNTVVIDRQEQVPIHDCNFNFYRPYGTVKVLRWESDENRDLLEAEHTGYTRLDQGIIHRRIFILDKMCESIEIIDKFIGTGEHFLEWSLHLDAKLSPCEKQGEVLILRNGTPILNLALIGWKSEVRVKEGWISRAYNQRERSMILHFCVQEAFDSPPIRQLKQFRQKMNLIA